MIVPGSSPMVCSSGVAGPTNLSIDVLSAFSPALTVMSTVSNSLIPAA